MFEVLDVEQGSKEWLEIRRKNITATDIPIICGVNPYETIEELIEKKISGKEKEFDAATKSRFEKGHEAERTLRKLLNRRYALETKVLISTRLRGFMASLDGFDQGSNVIFESKYTARPKFKSLRAGEIPLMHMYQMQGQLFVSNARYCIYGVTDNETYHFQDVYPDENTIEYIIEKVTEFRDQLEMLRSCHASIP